MSPADTSAPSVRRPRASRAGDGTVPVLPAWPRRTVAVLSTVGGDVHAIPVSATFLAEGNVAFTARGRATVVEEPMTVDPESASVSIAVDHVDDHRQPAFRVTAGVDREWVDQAARAAAAARVHALSNASVPHPETPTRSAP